MPGATMASDFHDWLERLGDKPLPVAATVRAACVDRLADDRQPLSAITPLLAQDPGLTLALLRHVNAKRRRSGHGITTVDSAVGLMGKGSVEELLAATHSIEDLTENPDQRAHFAQLRWRAFHASIQARHWAAQRQDRSPSEAAVMAQLASVGDMLLCAHDYDRYHEIADIVLSQPCSDRCAEHRTLGISLLELGHRYLERQGLDETILEAFDPMSVFNPRSVAVQLACELARLSERSWFSNSMAHCLSVAADFLKCGEETVDRNVHATALEAAHAWTGGATPSAANLIWPTEARREAAAPKPSASATPAAPPQAAATTAARKIASGATPAEVLQGLVQALKDMAGLHRALFFLLARDRKTLSPRFASGLDSQAPVMKSSFELSQARLFQQLLGKPVAVWIHPDNYEKLGIGLPRALIGALQSRNLFLMSVFVGKQPIGVVLSDADDEPLAQRDYATFKQLTTLASRRLSQLRGTQPKG